ncbi:MAG: hypothetical protein PHU85_07245 [Phycisphaerae bacterium]|nr:hypothetical protein [Phycisphaerae bacterium]
MDITEKTKGAALIPRQETINWAGFTEGSFTLSFQNTTTDQLAWNASYSDVETALALIDTVGSASSGADYHTTWTHDSTTGNDAITASDPNVAVTQDAAYQAAVDEVQTVTFTTATLGGYYLLAFEGYTTSALVFSSTASSVADALIALASIGATNVSVTNAVGGGFDVSFIGTLAAADQNMMTATDYTVVLADLDLSGYVATTSVVGGQYVLTGNDNYTGGTAGTLTLPAVGKVDTTAGAYGVGGTGSTPTLDLTDLVAGNIKDGVTINGVLGTFTNTTDYQLKTDSVLISAISATIVKSGETITATSGATHVDGTYDPMSAAVWPAVANVSTVETAWGPTGAEYAGTLNMTLYCLISTVVDAAYVVTGHDNRTGGDAGTYPTTATSQGVQLASDQASVLAAAEYILSGHSILEQAGTLDLSTYQLKTDSVLISAISAGDVASGATITATSGGTHVDGTFTHTTDYCLISSVVAAAYTVTGHDNYTGGDAGTYPTTATSQAAQLATDQAAVLAAAAYILEGHSILSQAGTLDEDNVLVAGGGTYVVVAVGNVKWGTMFGPASTLEGTYGGTTGTGTRTITVTIDDGTDPLENAWVRLTNGGQSYTGKTNASGVIVFAVDDATWAVAITKAAYTHTPTTLVVTANAAPTYSMTAVSFTPSSPTYVTGYLYVYDNEGVAETSIPIELALYTALTAGIAHSSETRIETSDATGLVEFTNLMPGATYMVRRGSRKTWNPITATEYQLEADLDVLWSLLTIPVAATDPYEMPVIWGEEVA